MGDTIMLSPYSRNQYDPANKNTTWFKMVSMVPQDSYVLDVGCSTGTLGSVLKSEKNARVVGIDITSEDVKLAKKVLDDAFVWDIENQPLDIKKFGSEKFDVIVFADVLEHMKDSALVLQKVKKLLKPDGRLVFSIPNMAHMFVRLQLLEGSFRYTETGLLDYTHLHFYDDVEVGRIFKEADYAIKHYDCTTFDYPDGLLAEKLNNLGLKLTPKFSKLAHTKQAVIFEYVGWAQPLTQKDSAPKHAPVGTSSPLEEVLAYVQRTLDSDENKVKELTAKVKATEAHVAKLEKELESHAPLRVRIRKAAKKAVHHHS